MALRNRVALVTGGSRGIGRGIALRLAQEGARIAFAYRANKAAAQTALRRMQALGADCVAVETDITEPGRAEQLVNTVADRYGRIDILVNNVGDFRWNTLAESSVEEWQSIFDSERDERVFDVPHGAADDAQGTLGKNHQSGRGGSGARLRAGEDQRVCLGEGGSGGDCPARWRWKKRKTELP